MKESLVKAPEWLKPGIFGAAVGAVALAIVGFSAGGWMTGGTAEEMASEMAQIKVVAALAPICVEQSKRDPQVLATLATLKEAGTYQRNNLLIETGWATMPGSTEADRDVASACMDILAAQS